MLDVQIGDTVNFTNNQGAPAVGLLLDLTEHFAIVCHPEDTETIEKFNNNLCAGVCIGTSQITGLYTPPVDPAWAAVEAYCDEVIPCANGKSYNHLLFGAEGSPRAELHLTRFETEPGTDVVLDVITVAVWRLKARRN